ncbi:hypothetical protein HK096_007437, partial [Nowakowskiella sp. JEL0078]
HYIHYLENFNPSINIFLLSSSVKKETIYTSWYTHRGSFSLSNISKVQGPEPLRALLYVLDDKTIVEENFTFDHTKPFYFVDKLRNRINDRDSGYLFTGPYIIHSKYFATFVRDNRDILENFVFVSPIALNYNYINALIGNKLDAGSVSSRHVLSSLEYRLSIILYIAGIGSHKVSLSYINSPLYNPNGKINLKNSVINKLSGSKRDYSTSSEYKLVSSISSSLTVLSSLLGSNNSSAQYDIECQYIPYLNNLLGSKPLRHSNKLFFIARDILYDRIGRNKFPITKVIYDWLGVDSYLLSEDSLTVALSVLLQYQSYGLIFLSKRIAKAILSNHVSSRIRSYLYTLKGVSPDDLI